MEGKSITARVCAFLRAYHSENNNVKIFDDNIARLLLTEEEYRTISKNLSDGIKYFNPSFVGNDKEALRWIVDNQLSPTPLGRAIFMEKSLEIAVQHGAMQYLILAAGYDTFAYRQPDWAEKLQIFEIDHPATASDKKERLKKSGVNIADNVHFIEADFVTTKWEKPLIENINFDENKISFCSLLGMTYYLSNQSFKNLISIIASIITINSSIVFDYPNENYFSAGVGNKHSELTEAANEKMLACYSYSEMEKVLSDYGFLIFEHLTPSQITDQYFSTYNKANPMNLMTAPKNVNYCLAVKK
ncbi:class I SAM-dependent methyltransferase [Aminipila sp.]|uniref:class I SAM-dependent methyltransferase n=1 Tax=Aminipila sp. TaxID=2060095 RepID=UPI00289A841D|nr:class I SAM-dependent methyltransferase [Aminipila sp.]